MKTSGSSTIILMKDIDNSGLIIGGIIIILFFSAFWICYEEIKNTQAIKSRLKEEKNQR
jgi:hypothetical protein